MISKKIKEYPLDGQLVESVRKYIDLNLEKPEPMCFAALSTPVKRSSRLFGSANLKKARSEKSDAAGAACMKQDFAVPPEACADAEAESCENVCEERSERKELNRIPAGINDIKAFLEDGFPLTLMKLIDKKGRTDVDVYKKAGCSKQTWYKIMNDANYKPSKKTAIAFALSLGLNFPEAQALLGTAGYTLSRSNVSDLIVEYCLNNAIYDLIEVDAILFRFDQETIGSKL